MFGAKKRMQKRIDKVIARERKPSLGDEASYMEETRLAHKEREQDQLKEAVLKAEKKILRQQRTQEALKHLGMGSPYGER